MRREVSLDEISDGKLYDLNDMVKADCHDCTGCSRCCRGMGRSVVLDPMDFYRLTVELGLGVQELMDANLELNMVDGLILPNLRMDGERESCSFLDGGERCSIHPFRPGICRLFPLGRYYREGGFRYFLQVHECGRENRSKIKVQKWIDTPKAVSYERYICDWHNHLLELGARVAGMETEAVKQLCMELLNRFYFLPYREGDFYQQFYQRLEQPVVR